MSEYFDRKRRHLRAHLSAESRQRWERLSKELKRELTAVEIRTEFGWINGQGQHTAPWNGTVLDATSACSACSINSKEG